MIMLIELMITLITRVRPCLTWVINLEHAITISALVEVAEVGYFAVINLIHLGG